MELREYLRIRRAHNLVRQELPSEERLTFLELAILCKMHLLKRPMNTSEIADYQDALRPTMTHRTKHLSSLGFIARQKGEQDRRNVSCTVTDEGVSYIARVCKKMCEVVRGEGASERVSQRRMECFVEAMGALTCMSSDLVLLGVLEMRGGVVAKDAAITVSALVSLLGLLQPTVSMSVASLEKAGLVVREGGSHTPSITLSDEGAKRADDLRVAIGSITPRR